LFIGLGIWSVIQGWRRRDRPVEEEIPTVARHPFWLTAGFLFVAEFGDKTQIAVIILAATAAAPFSVFAGASLAESLIAVTSVFIGVGLTKALAARWVEGASTALFLIAGVLLILEALSIV
jgi:putative Ca2+/H+ antiporter (TMEM165/GDT1 family)